MIKKTPMKKIKAAQQEMIDQAKHNLATPIKFKFSGIYSKYVNGIRKRELKIRRQLEQLEAQVSNEESKNGRTFAQMNEADQIDDVIMKYILNKSEKPDTFRQFSLIQDVNQDMVLEQIPQIAYD